MNCLEGGKGEEKKQVNFVKHVSNKQEGYDNSCAF